MGSTQTVSVTVNTVLGDCCFETAPLGPFTGSITDLPHKQLQGQVHTLHDQPACTL